MQMVANYDVLLAGRFLGGMGVGASSMLSPQFLAENSPKSVRGSMTATYNLMIVTSLALAFWTNYGVSLWKGHEHDNRQWRVAMGIQIIPGALMCLMIPFVPETPRYLINQGKSEKGLKNLVKLRKLPADHPYVQMEYSEIEAQTKFEQEVICFSYCTREPVLTMFRHVKATAIWSSFETSSRTKATSNASSWP